MNKTRQSNIEALRILCMLYIIMHHFIVFALPMTTIYSPTLGIEWDLIQIMDAFCYCAVNVFVLISGYFGIHPKFKSFFNLYLMCAFYVFVLYNLHLYAIGDHINRWSIIYTIMPFSYNPGWWFIMCYVLLYLLSPILNAAIDTFDKRHFVYALILLTVVNLYFGFYRNQSFANYGYSISHFVYMYFIGAYLKKRVTLSSMGIEKWRWGLFFSYFIGSLILGGITILNARYIHNDTSAWLYAGNYNHPLLIINAITLFMFFETFQFKSKAVNYISPSVLAVYLIHECDWFYSEFYGFVAEKWEAINNPVGRIGALFIMCVIVFILCIGTDQIRRGIAFPIVKYTNKVYCACKQKMFGE